MKINPSLYIYRNYNNHNNDNKKENNAPQTQQATKPFELTSKFNDHLIAFGARVDKGLERFYEANKDHMPVTVKNYIEQLNDKTPLSPTEAQKNAFAKLETAQTIEDIKTAYPDEPLFQNLINPTESKATRGLLNSVKENDELLALSNQGVLKDKTNLTVYLVKKIFLEGKTIEEINNDLETDLDEDFKADFKFKNKDKTTETHYIYGSTLKALGIKTPDFEYQQSLRYTRDGYSDMVGEKISQGIKAFFDALPEEERTARNKKSVQNFENWWNSLSKNQKLDMIADQLTTLDMLKDYKKFKRNEAKPQQTTQKTTRQEKPQRQHTKIESKILKQDELFIKWATNNLKIFEATMTEADKDTLHIKRMQRLSARWKEMTPEQKTDYISKMKSGSEPLRFTMIDAWNHSMDLIKDLSLHLKQNQIYKPADLIYSTDEFSQFQSQVMTDFWQNHPEYATMLGENITASQEKVKDAISRGTFEELKKQIMRDKTQRIKELEKFKAQLPKTNDFSASKAEEPQYKKDFKKAYDNHVYGKIKSMPKNAYNDLYDSYLDTLPEDIVKLWIKNLNGEPLSSADAKKLKDVIGKELPQTARFNRALEAAFADTLYDCTKDPAVYQMSNSDVKIAMYHLERNESPIHIISHKIGREFVLRIDKNKINPARINMLYEMYKQSLSDDELDEITDLYFEVKDNNRKEELKEYINQYGKSALILFSDKSTYNNDVKNNFYKKFLMNMPESLHYINCYIEPDNLQKEAEIKKAKFRLEKRFDFIPTAFMDVYFKEAARTLRCSASDKEIKNYSELACAKRKTPKDNAKLGIVAKSSMRTENKLKMLAMEQALADVLYEATGNSDVYLMQFEELCDNIELFLMIKKYPTEERTYTLQKIETPVTITAYKRPDIKSISRRYTEYFNEIKDWVNEDVKNSGTANFEDLLYILNPEENVIQKDLAVIKRMSYYGFNLKHFNVMSTKININPDEQTNE